MNKNLIIVAGFLAISAALLIYWQQSSVEVAVTTDAVHKPEVKGGDEPVKTKVEKPQAPKLLDKEIEDELVQQEDYLLELDQEAIESLEQARLEGDERTPPITRQKSRELPTDAQLADPELYAAYEQQQQKVAYRMYVEAAKEKVKVLNDMIEQGKQQGISEEEIEFAEQKIRGIENMSLQLQEQHPEIMGDDYAPQQPDQQDIWLEQQ